MASNYLIILILLVTVAQVTSNDETSDEEATYDPVEVEKTLFRAIELNRLASTPELRHSKRPKTSPQDGSAKKLLDTLRPSTSRALAYEIEDEPKDDKALDPDWCPESFQIANRNITIATMKKIIELHDMGRSEAKIRNKYRWYRRQYLPRFRDCVSRGYKRSDVYRLIREAVYQKFLNSREKGLPVRGYNIRSWALREARKHNLGNFTASYRYLTMFKKAYRISSRKVTKIVSSSDLANRIADGRKIIQFREDFSRACQFFKKKLIFNVDQTGFNLEPSTDRTLSSQGERDTMMHARSSNKQTHSYTAQPVISREGRVVGKLTLVLQEDKGRFGPLIQKKVRKMEQDFSNVKLYPSKSGKMNSSLTADWMIEVLLPGVNEFLNSTASDEDEPLPYDEQTIRDNGALILLDEDIGCRNETHNAFNCSRLTWPRTVYCGNQERHAADARCFSKPKALILFDSWAGNKNITRIGRPNRIKSLLIPERTTGELQPLDVGFMRQYKIFVNRVAHQALFDNMIKDISTREGIVNMHSLIWNQFNSPAYDAMHRWCWHKTDLNYNETERGELPLMVRAIQFAFVEPTCSHENCQCEPFIRCSHCGRVLCLRQFLERTCFHERQENSSEPVDRAEALRILGGVEDDEDEEVLLEDVEEQEELEEIERSFF